MAMRSQRLKQMEQYILERDSATMEELCEQFGISMNTVRMDVSALVNKGSIKKVYGGVCCNRSGMLLPFEERGERNLLQKRAIAKAAARFVDDNDVIFIDSGSTTMHMVEFLEDKRNIIIITTSLEVVTRAAQLPDAGLICVGGKLDRAISSFTDMDAHNRLAQFNISKVFMASTGLGAKGQVTNSAISESEIKRVLVNNGAQSYLLIDSSKYGKAALTTYATLGQFHGVITDDGAGEDFRNLCEQYDNLKMVYATF